MRKLVHYIDGFIAGPKERFDFFAFKGDLAAAVLADHPETTPGPAHEPLGVAGVAGKRFVAILTGRGTYEPGPAVGLTSPYPHLKQYVFSRTPAQPDPEVEIASSDPVEFVHEPKRQDGMDIRPCGGTTLAGQLFGEIDELAHHGRQL